MKWERKGVYKEKYEHILKFLGGRAFVVKETGVNTGGPYFYFHADVNKNC
jgi:hypothetical protein